jgi:hypothetical protein
LPISPQKANSTNPEANVANRFVAEAFFQLSQDFGLGDLFKFVMQSRLQDADIENAFAQRDRCGVGGNRFADDFSQASMTSVSCRRSRNPSRRISFGTKSAGAGASLQRLNFLLLSRGFTLSL